MPPVFLHVPDARQGRIHCDVERLAELPLQALRSELSQQVQIRDAMLEEALAQDLAAFSAASDEERRVHRQYADEAMERLGVLNREVVWPIEAEIRRRERAGA